MYYRYEARYNGGNWQGIFQALNPSERRSWHNLSSPKWYDLHPEVESKAWFTQHGYEKWKKKMEETIENFHNGYTVGWEFRLITKENLGQIAFRGKTQIIELI